MIAQALQRVGNNSVSLTFQARIRLNRILQDLHQGWDWPFLWTTATLQITTGGVVAMPADFLKAEDDQALTIISAGGQTMRRPVQEVEHKVFEQRATDLGGTIPAVWTIDYKRVFGLVTGRVWPRPTSGATATLRYKYLPPDMPVGSPTNPNDPATVAYDADIPSFPWDSFLIDALSEWAMAYEVDPRRAEQLTINGNSLAVLRNATWPERSFPMNVPLDPLYFSTPTWGSGRSD